MMMMNEWMMSEQKMFNKFRDTSFIITSEIKKIAKLAVLRKAF